MPQVVDLRKIKPDYAKASSGKQVPKETPEKGGIEPVKKIKQIEVETKTTTPTKLEWTALEFKKYKKGKKWSVFPILIALAVIIAAILLKNLLLVLATILTVFVVYVYAFKKPRKLKFIISGNGVQIDQIIYKFEDLKSFWIFYEPASLASRQSGPADGPPEVKEISFRSKKTLMPYIKVPLEDQNPAEVRRLLLKFLPEKKHQVSIVDEWVRRSKF